MKKTFIAASALGLVFTCNFGSALAAPDWSKVPSKKITVFYPGTAAIEWVTKGTDHGGAKALKKGESCAGCHDEEAADIGRKITSGEKLEPIQSRARQAAYR